MADAAKIALVLLGGYVLYKIFAPDQANSGGSDASPAADAGGVGGLPGDPLLGSPESGPGVANSSAPTPGPTNPADTAPSITGGGTNGPGTLGSQGPGASTAPDGGGGPAGGRGGGFLAGLTDPYNLGAGAAFLGLAGLGSIAAESLKKKFGRTTPKALDEATLEEPRVRREAETPRTTEAAPRTAETAEDVFRRPNEVQPFRQGGVKEADFRIVSPTQRALPAARATEEAAVEAGAASRVGTAARFGGALGTALYAAPIVYEIARGGQQFVTAPNQQGRVAAATQTAQGVSAAVTLGAVQVNPRPGQLPTISSPAAQVVVQAAQRVATPQGRADFGRGVQVVAAPVVHAVQQASPQNFNRGVQVISRNAQSFFRRLHF